MFSPSVEIDSAWDPVRNFVKGMEQHGLFSEWDEKALMRILDEQRAKVKELKATKTRKPLPQGLSSSTTSRTGTTSCTTPGTASPP